MCFGRYEDGILQVRMRYEGQKGEEKKRIEIE
jgi:HSP20 family molecular chaperone IbpA